MANIILEEVREKLKPQNVMLVAVSKTKPNEAILEMYNENQRVFGENKVQELVEKYEALPKDIEWHLIGHLQTNKVKYIAPFVRMIHSIDSLKLLKEVNKQAKRNDRTIDCLLQMHIADEDTKFGFNHSEVKELLESEIYKNFENIRIVGVMGMATFTDDTEQVRQEFNTLKYVFENLKLGYFQNDEAFSEISMGMSGDFEIAMEEGSTMVRVGSLLFGNR
ncbi:MAG: YggS family pyridoxal phosphate-dependent enzyme [Saprospiraceae bacterium]|nr:YggS family pyridoxal phosphate-dependent enzyme [Saprospiraceae bacterium]